MSCNVWIISKKRIATHYCNIMYSVITQNHGISKWMWHDNVKIVYVYRALL